MAQRCPFIAVSVLAIFANLPVTVTAQEDEQPEMDLACPILQCEQGLEPGVCYTHDAQASAEKIVGGLCYDVETASQTDQVLVCPFNTEDYMWIEEIYQGQGKNEAFKKYSDTSQVRERKRIAQCKDAGYLRQMLNPGRTCSMSSQCKSRDCREICVGYEQNEACHKHEDCVQGFYCHDAEEWPFTSTCRLYRDDNAVCTQDFQCPITHFCWYRSKEDRESEGGTKRCMEMYSQEAGTSFGWEQESTGRASLEDHTQNGKFCKSGLARQASANEAQCTVTSEITFNGQTLDAPYACKATDPNIKCKVVYDVGDESTTDNYIETFCRCSMSSTEAGFCESVIGTETYAKAVRAKKLLYTESNCHTLDRENMRAQRDKCGIGSYTDEWRFAVDKQFNVTHWPYVQDDSIYHCVQKFFSDSYINESLDQARGTLVASALVALAISNYLL